MDEIILSFISGNYLTITLGLGLLKLIAIETPWAGDDKIIEILTGMLNRAKAPKLPKD